MTLTQRDILAPKKQKFGIGDLVRALDPWKPPSRDGPWRLPVRPDLRQGDLYRILGSYAQRGPKSPPVPDRWIDPHIYEVIHTERLTVVAWVPEAHLKLVLEPKKAPTNLYLLTERNQAAGREFESFIIRAKSSREARWIAFEEGGVTEMWLDTSLTTCHQVNPSGKAGVIHRSLNTS